MENHAINDKEAADTKAPTPMQQQLASVWYECKDGTVTQNPKDCWATNHLPELKTDHLSKS